MKKVLFIMLAVAFGATAVFAAGEATLNAGVGEIVDGAVSDGKKVGGGVLYTVAGWAPFILMLGGLFVGLGAGFKSKAPDDGWGGVGTKGGIGFACGLAVTFLVWAGIGIAAGGITKGPGVTVHYVKSSLESTAGNDVFNTPTD